MPGSILGEAVHALGDDLTSHNTACMEVRIPELYSSQTLEPAKTDEETEDYAGLVIFTAGIPSCVDHILCDDAAVWVGQEALFDLARNNLLDLILQSQSDFRNLV